MTMMCRKYVIDGRVQGVWFRASTQDQAKKLGLTGYAKNMPDGSVEVIACGDEDSLNELTRWLWVGPDASHVTSISQEEVSFTNYSDFTTK